MAEPSKVAQLLKDEYPDLYDLVQSSPAEYRRAIATSVALYSLNAKGYEHTLLEMALPPLREKRSGSGMERDTVLSLLKQLRREPDQSLRHLISSVFAALQENVEIASYGSVYEAAQALPDSGALKSVIKEASSGTDLESLISMTKALATTTWTHDSGRAALVGLREGRTQPHDIAENLHPSVARYLLTFQPAKMVELLEELAQLRSNNQ